MQEQPVFLVGCGRSGTTMLRLMLDSHPMLAIPGESSFIRYRWAERRAYWSKDRFLPATTAGRHPCRRQLPQMGGPRRRCKGSSSTHPVPELRRRRRSSVSRVRESPTASLVGGTRRPSTSCPSPRSRVSSQMPSSCISYEMVGTLPSRISACRCSRGGYGMQPGGGDDWVATGFDQAGVSHRRDTSKSGTRSSWPNRRQSCAACARSSGWSSMSGC